MVVPIHIDDFNSEIEMNIWNIIFENGYLSLWACLYCIDGCDEYETRRYIKLPNHCLIYGLETGNLGNVLETIKKDDFISFVVYLGNLAPIDNINDNINNLLNNMKESSINDIIFNRSDIEEVLLEISIHSIVFKFKFYDSQLLTVIRN